LEELEALREKARKEREAEEAAAKKKAEADKQNKKS
jgi:hypothetical protein